MKKIISKIVKIANKLDENGYHLEADKITFIASRIAQMKSIEDVDSLESDPMFVRYKMEYDKNKNFEDPEMRRSCEEKILAALSIHIEEGQEKEIFEGWLETGAPISVIAENYATDYENNDFLVNPQNADDSDILGVI